MKHLPTSVLQLIMRFADGAYATEMYPHAPSIPRVAFSIVSAAITSWRPAIQEVHAAFDSSVVDFSFTQQDVDATRDGAVYSRLAAVLEPRKSTLRCLRLGLDVRDFCRNFEVVLARRFSDAFDQQSIPWESLLTQSPQLERLDLSGLPLRSSQLAAVLEAASRHCRRLQSLVLPRREWYRGLVRIESEPFFDRLSDLLACWPALRHLSLPQRVYYLPTEASASRWSADRLLRSLAFHCADIEYIDGWRKRVFEQNGVVDAEASINCSLDAFDAFCRSCVKLRELHWHPFPFSPAYFRVFATTPKPSIEKLILASNKHISSFTGESTDATEQPASVAATDHATVLHEAIAACTHLRELEIVVRDALADDVPDAMDWCVNDSLLRTVSEHCPLLRRLTIRYTDASMAEEQAVANAPVDITDRGLVHLARLPDLQHVRLTVHSSSNVDGIAALITSSRETGMPRRIDVVIGSDDDDFPDSFTTKRSPRFPSIVVELLSLLVADHEAVSRKHFHVELKAGTGLFSSHRDTKSQQQLEDLADKVTLLLPRLQLHVHRQGSITGVTLLHTDQSEGSHRGVQTQLYHRPQQEDWRRLGWCVSMVAAAAAWAGKVYTSQVSTDLLQDRQISVD